MNSQPTEAGTPSAREQWMEEAAREMNEIQAARGHVLRANNGETGGSVMASDWQFDAERERQIAERIGVRIRHYDPEPLVKNAVERVLIETGQPVLENGDLIHWRLWQTLVESEGALAAAREALELEHLARVEEVTNVSEQVAYLSKELQAARAKS